jgi:type IV secretory pathway TrbD component
MARVICIPEAQRQVHVAAETAALVLVVPFLGWIAAQRGLAPWARWTAGAVALGTLAVDGWLLSKYATAGD